MKIFISLLFCVAYALAVPQKGWPVSLDMSCEKSLTAAACSFEFLNVADEDYYLLKRNTPLEGLISQFIAVSYEGQPLKYEGILIHRNPPTKDEFVLLKAGQRIAATVQINDAFTLSDDGSYTVEYIKPLIVTPRDEMSMMTEVTINEVIYIDLEGARHLSRPSTVDEDTADFIVNIESCTTASFTGGTSSQRSDILKGHKKLCKEFADAKANVSNSDFYKTWFGTYTTARANHVKGVCQKCVDGLTSKSVTYIVNPSNCKSNWNAYTYKGGTKVYLCPAYDSKSVYCKSSGDPTKEGILAHEWSHAFGYTDDYTYGEKDNKNLAKSDPDKAVKNADTYEYYYCLTQF